MPEGTAIISDRSALHFARGCGLLAVAVGLVVPAGWGGAPMRPWATVLAVILGGGLVLVTARPRRSVRVSQRIVAAAAVAVVLAAMAGGDPASGGLMPIVAVESLLAAALLVPAPPSFRHVAAVYTAVASLGGALALAMTIAHLYSATAFHGEGILAGSSAVASAVLLVLFAGFLAARPDIGIVRTLTRPYLGGTAARRLLPLIAIGPLTLGWVLVAVAAAFDVDPSLSMALFAVLAVAMLIAIVAVVAGQLSRLDAERRWAVETARRNQERLALAQEVVGAGAWDWDLSTGECTWSDSYFRLFGLDPATTASSHAAFFERVHPEDRAAIAALMEAVLPNSASLQCEYRIVRPDGVLRHIATLASIHRDADNRAQRVSGLNFDVTERVEMTAALTAAKRDAERAAVAKSKFLASVSHDLRQPVQSLVLFVGVLRQRLEGAAVGRILGGIEHSVEALRLMLDALLDVSRLDAGIIEARIVAVPLGPLLAALDHEYRPRAQAFGLRLHCVATAATVRSDPLLLERILRNLIENALRYTRHGGVVVGCHRRGETVALAVCDSGIGIAPEDEAAIFEEFFQIGNPERDRAKGLGLGLAIVDRLARLLDHRVSVRSRPGHGSCFTVTMPAALPVTAASAPPAADRRHAVTHDMVMVIEDEELVRESLNAALTGWGYEVATAGSIEDAVAEIGHHRRRPALVISDYRLRGGEVGPVAIEAVRKRCGTAIPGLIITGDTAPERLKEARAAGYALVHKPFSTEALRDVVASLTRH
ncbi:MAG: PAS domain-containing protein [Magnetospirillum sp.]|nr:PAS domain-containing protein [Magnetospirillum sp.]